MSEAEVAGSRWSFRWGIFDFLGGKIVRWQAFDSRNKALEALGLTE